jgi:outer membrane protein TolC
MALVTRAGDRARFALVLLLAVTGCSSAKPQVHQSTFAEIPSRSADGTPRAQLVAPRRTDSRLVKQRLPTVEPRHAVEQVVFLGEAELSLPQLLHEVESRNPSVQAMAYAWQAAAQRYPQAVSLDDPMFMVMMAPASFGSNQVESAYILQGSQKLPWFGKRPTRGQAAQAEASAAFHDMNDTRLQINQVTRVAFYDYYLVHRELELIDRNSAVMREFRDTAQAKYENNQVTQQDVLQADVELADTQRRRIEIERMRRVAIARINTLLRRAPMDTLPPPPSELLIEEDLPQVADLQQLASIQRPDLGALAARVRAEEAAVELALRQYYPDAEFFGRYDSFWQPAATQSDLRGQVGMNMNVPLYRRKLQAAVCEAQFRLSQRRAELQQRQLDIQYEVQAAYEAVQESQQAAELYAKKYLPFAEQNVEAARSNYDVGAGTFLSLAQAQRQLIEVRAKYQQTIADYHRRKAELERAVGGDLPGDPQPEEIFLPESP